MNKELKTLQDKVEVILSLIMKTKEFHNFSKHFNDINNPKYKILLSELKMQGYITFMGYSFYRNTIIELNNLFDSTSNDKFSLVNFINKFTPGSYHAKYNPNQEYISNWLRAIEKNSSAIRNIKILRDKYYAHYDNFIDPVDLYVVSNTEIDNLLLLADDIIKYFYLLLHDSSLDTTPPYTYGEPIGLLNLISIGRAKKIQDEIDIHFINKR